ncbi:molybdopterin-dependent oxidoreductase [Psychromarinibacter sp. C21-152]|uniref:Molybdopterin-dependent oxidoreductase n=1 Tax=Psychromarinibacter sediminicola TaxID=3033385 RepID=A0AAE3NQJ4_9RHOB|nr:molybdopterin cofactor-binding domain-containing protein [Psychromarinibacter sediminicola]MDF0600267.1 molybdopterin-dependent oxidoreductase [Psychromarinibacter sediminicola]
MTRAATITRRTLLIGATAIAGGVAFGAWAVRHPHDNPLAEGLGAGEASFNPWVKVTGAGITLITPHADLGQGAVHMQAALIAEEMDLEFGQFDTAFGPPDPAYYNRAMAAEAGAAMAALTPISAAMAEAVAGGAMKLFGVQGTGGSTSAPDSFDKLREAGAVARETLKRAAEELTGVSAAEMTTEAGRVILPDGRALPYTDLAAVAAEVAPVRDVVLRPSSEWRLIGRPMARIDMADKVTGRQVYGIDLAPEGMLHAAVRTSPRRGEVLSYDASAAAGMRGVQDVIAVTGGVAVLADNTWRAFRALDAVEIAWGPAAYPAEQAEHWEAVGASFTDARMDAEWRADGDAAAALSAGADVAAEYRAPYVAHQPLEPLNAVVLVTEPRVEVWTAHQLPRFLQQRVAGVTGHDAEQVVLHNQFAGGSFGHRLEFEHVTLAAEIANARRGTPVKLTYSREQDFATDFPRHIAMARGRGAVADGHVTAIDIDVAGAPVTASQMGRIGLGGAGPDTQLPAGVWNAPYGPEHFRVRSYAVPGLAPVSSWRSVGASCGGFFIETLMDELCHAAGADPVEERLRLMTDPVARGVLEAAAEMAGWGRDPGEDRGLGVALVESFGVPVAEIVEVTATEGGIRIDAVWVASDSGTVIDPVNIENHIQGAVVWGLGHAMNSEITYRDGMAEQSNYHAAEGMRMHQCPRISVRTLEAAPRIRGIGEPPVPPAAPALGNAIFAATGQRLREMPFRRHVRFV